ncbi:AraC family transcriptional regulator [Leptospira jelokensis]|uniref:AraC family transcriptional regulator n=1 Tax=Leptospira jelokensis TaxID=2484931 RepID=A0A4Z0ZXU3_9LEPT|nr:AraC family transcriptional regulator [Leptospira jelokensis]TGL57830.1 AraC family transcriptional regulator [Leptospira jelokensis]
MKSKTSNNDTIQKLKKSRRFIEDHYSESIGLEEISNSAHLSLFHFHRMFKSYFEMTCIDYLIQVRLEKSLQLLVYSKKSISEISFEVGFPNTETYIRNFKKLYKTTPGMYRKNTTDHFENLKPLELQREKAVFQNPFQMIKNMDSFPIAIMRTDAKDKIFAKTLHRLLDKTISLGVYNHEICFYGRSLDPPKLPHSKLERWELGVKVPKEKRNKLPFPLEVVTWKKGRYLVINHRGTAKELEATYMKAYQYIIHSPFPIANDPCWEVYKKIPPFHQNTEIDIFFRLEE